MQDPAGQYLLLSPTADQEKCLFFNLEQAFTFFWKLTRRPPRLTSTKATPVTCCGATLPLRPSSTPAALTNRIRATKKERKKKSPSAAAQFPYAHLRESSEHTPASCCLVGLFFSFFFFFFFSCESRRWRRRMDEREMGAA